jgi:hypothetical protein
VFEEVMVFCQYDLKVRVLRVQDHTIANWISGFGISH